MRSQRKRIERLESRKPDEDRITDFEITIVDSKEQVQHPERFNKVLDSEKTFSTGITRKMYHLERKTED